MQQTAQPIASFQAEAVTKLMVTQLAQKQTNELHNAFSNIVGSATKKALEGHDKLKENFDASKARNASLETQIAALEAKLKARDEQLKSMSEENARERACNHARGQALKRKAETSAETDEALMPPPTTGTSTDEAGNPESLHEINE
jgi:hypothetical protein